MISDSRMTHLSSAPTPGCDGNRIVSRRGRVGGLLVTAVAMVSCTQSDPLQPTIDQLLHGDTVAKRAAVQTLIDLGPAAAPAVPALTQLINGPDAELRRLACRALGAIGPPAATAMPALGNALQDPEFTVRLAAAVAVPRIEPASTQHHPVLIEAMRLGEGGTIVAAGRAGPASAWAVPTLTDLLHDRRPGIRRLAAEALGQIGPAATPALTRLEAALQDPDDRVRSAAEAALSALRSSGDRPQE